MFCRVRRFPVSTDLAIVALTVNWKWKMTSRRTCRRRHHRRIIWKKTIRRPCMYTPMTTRLIRINRQCQTPLSSHNRENRLPVSWCHTPLNLVRTMNQARSNKEQRFASISYVWRYENAREAIPVRATSSKRIERVAQLKSATLYHLSSGTSYNTFVLAAKYGVLHFVLAAKYGVLHFVAAEVYHSANHGPSSNQCYAPIVSFLSGVHYHVRLHTEDPFDASDLWQRLDDDHKKHNDNHELEWHNQLRHQCNVSRKLFCLCPNLATNAESLFSK